jgi:hypothetical protein
MINPVKPSWGKCALPFVWLACSSLSFAQFSVTTHHYDNSRTGWNSQETILTPANVGSSAFGVLKAITLDDQPDAQPLVVSNLEIKVNNVVGLHTVVYVATEGNTIYGIGANSGNVLLKVNLGPPVPFPLGCNNTPNTGINSTPVIDPVASIMYVIVYTQTASGPAYYIHALDLATLTDKVPPRLIKASHTLSNGTAYTFNAAVQRQRPGLLLANGNVYAGFGSFCDLAVNDSRGWLLGWHAGTLKPLASNQVFDTQNASPNDFFLSSIWMSGAGLAADYAGNVLFVTANSDPSGATYNGITDIQESAVKVSPDLSTVLDLFTPDNQDQLDDHDWDFGSGGIMLLPDQPGKVAHLAVAAGKDGNMYLMNEDSLGGHSTTTNNVLGTYQIGPCYCIESYFQDPKDGLARVVSSGGYAVEVWKLVTSPSPSLQLVTASVANGSPLRGFFTTVSSNGTSNPIIWSLSRGANSLTSIFLSAFDPETGSTTQNMNRLFNAQVGQWNSTGRPNLVPVVANGRVFVATLKQLAIYGLKY